MQITFAIITSGYLPDRVDAVIASIEALAIPDYEILVAGGEISSVEGRRNIRHLFFVEDRGGWITGKKNEATRQAQYDVIVYLHDYFIFDSDWYEKIVAFGGDWDIQMHQILSIEGERMLDWALYDHPDYPMHAFVPYDRTDLIPHQYISGGYWVSRRKILLEEPQDESRSCHHEEDLEWSRRVRNKYRILMNPGCVVRHNKRHRDIGYSEARAKTFGVQYKYQDN